jgi:hypothetical protein
MHSGLRVGAVAAATTIGAVIGLGLRHGLALRPFQMVGSALVGVLGISAGTLITIIVGLAMVVCSVIVLGVCFTVVAASLRGIRLLGVALAFAAIAWAVSVFVTPAILVLSSGTVLGTAQRVFVFTLLALALVVGMRLARSSSRME